jgi:hypothetical protein
MMMRDVVADLTALVLPLPLRPVGVDDDDAVLDGWEAVLAEVTEERERFADQLRLGWEEAELDPLLGQIQAARAAMLAAERRLRLLIAYGREFVGHRPYRLEDLAHAAGMSISGVRTAYDDDEVADVAALTGARPRRAPADPTPTPPAHSRSARPGPVHAGTPT